MRVERDLLDGCLDVLCVDLKLEQIAPVVVGRMQAQTIDFDKEDAIDHDRKLILDSFEGKDHTWFPAIYDSLRVKFKCAEFQGLEQDKVAGYFPR